MRWCQFGSDGAQFGLGIVSRAQYISIHIDDLLSGVTLYVFSLSPTSNSSGYVGFQTKNKWSMIFEVGDCSKEASKVKKFTSIHHFGASELDRKDKGCHFVIVGWMGLDVSVRNGWHFTILRP